MCVANFVVHHHYHYNYHDVYLMYVIFWTVTQIMAGAAQGDGQERLQHRVIQLLHLINFGRQSTHWLENTTK